MNWDGFQREALHAMGYRLWQLAGVQDAAAAATDTRVAEDAPVRMAGDAPVPAQPGTGRMRPRLNMVTCWMSSARAAVLLTSATSLMRHGAF